MNANENVYLGSLLPAVNVRVKARVLKVNYLASKRFANNKSVSKDR